MIFKILNSQEEAELIFKEGKPHRIRAGEKEICIVRKSQTYFAFENKCPHMGEKFNNAKTNYLNEVICPLHTYRFHMRSGNETNYRCRPLKTYKVEMTADGLHLHV